MFLVAVRIFRRATGFEVAVDRLDAVVYDHPSIVCRIELLEGEVNVRDLAINFDDGLINCTDVDQHVAFLLLRHRQWYVGDSLFIPIGRYDVTGFVFLLEFGRIKIVRPGILVGRPCTGSMLVISWLDVVVELFVFLDRLDLEQIL